MKFLWEQDMLKSSQEFENGSIPMHCSARVVIWRLSEFPVFNKIRYFEWIRLPVRTRLHYNAVAYIGL